ncbi:MAG: HEAT repeat domain-containing protein [Gemmatimonadaceae bacterium]|nr:HEAT repeat domain-containing protein [Gemmatimonadaceae bacterium]MCW5825941.1 HEAT repeat domain-containing protein [Gemmatimonadaceae bacterium]
MRQVILLLLVGSSLSAQDIASRVAAVGSGTVRMHFASDPGVCGNGRGSIRVRGTEGRSTVHNSGSIDARGRRAEWEDECESGPVRVALDVENRRVMALRSYVGGSWRGRPDADLGEVPAEQAVAYLMQLAATAEGRVAKDAILPAMLAEGPSPDREILAIAKDEGRPRDVRTGATFWLSQSAGARVTEGLQELLDDPERQVRESAVFALSQRPNDESVPALIRLARSHRDPQIRRTAVFWLGQKRDPRALAYFEEVLAP